MLGVVTLEVKEALVKLDSHEDTISKVIGAGYAIDFVCHRLARAGVTFFVRRTDGDCFIVTVDESSESWLKNAIYEYATKAFP